MNKTSYLIVVSEEANYVVRDLTESEFALIQSIFASAEQGFIGKCSQYTPVIEKCRAEWLNTSPRRYDTLWHIIADNFNGSAAIEEFIYDMVKKTTTTK